MIFGVSPCSMMHAAQRAGPSRAGPPHQVDVDEKFTNARLYHIVMVNFSFA